MVTFVSTGANERRSSAQARRPLVLSHAINRFAVGGWAGTTVADVAAAAGISTAYVIKLFPTKERLFIAALDECFERIAQTLLAASEDTPDEPGAVLDAMGDAYAHLITDRALLLMQVHAQSASFIPAIAESLRAGIARTVELVSTRSRASDAAVQQFFALGQLCHLIVTTGIDADAAKWARILTAGINHFDANNVAATEKPA